MGIRGNRRQDWALTMLIQFAVVCITCGGLIAVFVLFGVPAMWHWVKSLLIL